jgi:hypothetical protein
MPANHNFVCFDCRVNVRRFKLAEVAPLCPHCGSECTNLGYKSPIPPKDDLTAWERLYADLREAKRHLVTNQEKNRVALTHALERKLERIERDFRVIERVFGWEAASVWWNEFAWPKYYRQCEA